jgi:iron complex outermembrane receptor protein
MDRNEGLRWRAAAAVALGSLLLASSPGWTQSVQPAGSPAASGQATSDSKTSTQPQKPATDEQKQETQIPRLDFNVVVTAPRTDVPVKDTPAATTIVNELTLDNMPRTVGAEEALQGVPGVKVDNQADGERVHMSIRGQGLLTERGIRGITVLLDGIPLNDPSGFVPDLFDVEWSNVKRVEVLRGVASALYGGSSAGGVVNITTRDGGGAVNGDVRVDGGSYNFWKGAASVGATSGTVDYRITASGNTGDGYRLHTMFNSKNAYGKVRWTRSQNTHLQAIFAATDYYNDNAEGLNLAWTDLGQGVPWARQANPDALTFNEYQVTKRVTAGLTGRTKLSPNQEISFAAYFRHSWWRESVPSSVQHRGYNNPGGTFQYVLNSPAGPATNHLTLGTDVSWQGIDDYRYPNLGNGVEGTELLSNQTIAQRGVGLYAIDRLEFNPQWSAMVSLRNDHIRNELTDLLKVDGVDLSGVASFAKTTGRVGVTFNPREDVGLYASWGQGFLPPATEELANNPNGMGGFNQDLVPATSQGEEFGVRGASRGFSYDLAFFHLTTENDFGRYRVESRPLETFYGNVGASRRYGFEASVGYYPTAEMAVRGAYTFSDFLYKNVTFMFDTYYDKVMPNSPRHQVAFDVEYHLDRNWAFGLNAFGQSLQYVDQSNVPSADGFALFNPRIAYQWQTSHYGAEVMLSARNLFNDNYIAFTEPDPDGNSYQPGPGREAFVGVRFFFGK